MNENYGHGHVFKRPDGILFQCGGPGLCEQCTKDKAKKDSIDRERDSPFDSRSFESAFESYSDIASFSSDYQTSDFSGGGGEFSGGGASGDFD